MQAKCEQSEREGLQLQAIECRSSVSTDETVGRCGKMKKSWKENKGKNKDRIGLCNSVARGISSSKSVKIFLPALILMLNLASALEFLFKGFKGLFECFIKLLKNSINLKNKKENRSHNLVIASVKPFGCPRLITNIYHKLYKPFGLNNSVKGQRQGRITWLLRKAEDLLAVHSLAGSNSFPLGLEFPSLPSDLEIFFSMLKDKLKVFTKTALTTASSGFKLVIPIALIVALIALTITAAIVTIPIAYAAGTVSHPASEINIGIFGLVLIIPLLIMFVSGKKKLFNIIEKGESQELEFKESLRLDEIGENVSAFSNTNKGLILVGVSDSGEIKGVQIGKKTVEGLANYIKQHTDNPIYPKIKAETADGKNIIVIDVDEHNEKPVFFRGKAYGKVGKSVHKLSASEIRKLAKKSTKSYWDEQICEEASLQDINKEKVRWFLRKAKAERRFDVEPETPVKEALERLELMKKGRLTNAGILLFGKEPQKFFLQAETRCARFKGTEPVKPFIDMKVFSGNIIEQADDALNFVLEHVPMAAWLAPGKVAREEKYAYPSDAVREAIVNAICHRDYESPSNVQVRVFDDRVEIWNPGQLPTGWTVEKLKQKHESVPKNPLIADQFFLIKLIEKWGTGTNEMIRECLDWGLPDPIFEFTGTSLVVTLRGRVLTEELDKLGLNKRQKDIITYLEKHKEITRPEYQKTFNISERTANRELSKLVDLGIILKKGLGVRTYYALASFGELWRAISNHLKKVGK